MTINTEDMFEVAYEERKTRYGRNYDEYYKFTNNFLEKIRSSIEKNEDIYLYVTGGRHKASIVKILKIKNFYELMMNIDSDRKERDKIYINYGLYFDLFLSDNVKVGFDDRNNKLKFDEGLMRWLPDYKGPTIYNYDYGTKKEKKSKITPHDLLNNKIEAGDFIIFVENIDKSKSKLSFANVNEVLISGKIRVETIRLNSDDIKRDSALITNVSKVCVIKKHDGTYVRNLDQMAMMAKLQNG